VNEEVAFLDAIRSKPDDDVTRLVYADWLDEQGGTASTDKSAFLRLYCELAQKRDAADFLKTAKRLANMAANLDPDWLTVVSTVKIENCDLEFEYQCPKQWHKLHPTERDHVRFCEECQKHVYYCLTVYEARSHAWAGNCVAVQLDVVRSEGDLRTREGMGFLDRGYEERRSRGTA
jgi:uncharacterized protein (TIGR02996 family)